MLASHFWVASRKARDVRFIHILEEQWTALKHPKIINYFEYQKSGILYSIVYTV